jgi:hypothetical protein
VRALRAPTSEPLTDAARAALPAPFTVCAVLGLLPLSCSTQLVLATRRERVATLRGVPLWRVAATRLLACGAEDGGADEASAAADSAAADSAPAAAREGGGERSGAAAPSSAERTTDDAYVALLRLALQEPGLYYCDGADITRGEQAAAAAAAELGAGRAPRPFSVRAPQLLLSAYHFSRHACAVQETADGRFMWNAHLAAPLLAARAAAFVPPLVCGWAGATQVAWPEGGDAAVLEVTLLARRHLGRPGRRLWTRGLDARGAAANCVLSEQLLRVQSGGAVAAHVAARGSVPLLWAQPPNLVATPPLHIAPLAASLPPFRAHMAALRALAAGPVACLSLLRAHGREGRLGDAYGAAAAAAATAKAVGDAFLPFDFNAAAGASARGRAALLQLVGIHLRTHGVFCADACGAVRSTQAGFIRTNCLDTLDRTNLAQTAVALVTAEAQLAALAAAAVGADAAPAAAAGVMPPALSPALGEALRVLWAAQGDALSLQYTRTPAQRRDRSAPLSAASVAAWLRDAFISCRRYVQNNHADADACDAAALVSGAHVPPRRQRRGKEAAGESRVRWPFPRGAAARAVHAARRLPLLQVRCVRQRQLPHLAAGLDTLAMHFFVLCMQAAALLCGARVLVAMRALAALSGDLSGASAAFAAWTGALVAVVHVAANRGSAFVARPLFALADAPELHDS